jgi:hypothetical protein
MSKKVIDSIGQELKVGDIVASAFAGSWKTLKSFEIKEITEKGSVIAVCLDDQKDKWGGDKKVIREPNQHCIKIR